MKKNTLTLENKIFNIVVLLVFFAGFSTSIMNLCSSVPPVQTILSVTATMTSLAVYIFSIKTGKYHALAYPAIITFFILLLILWITSEGTNGSVGYYYALFIVAGILIVKKQHRLLLILITIITLIILYIIEYYYPSAFVPYASRTQRFFDVVIAMPIALVTMGLTMYIVFNHYLSEREQKDKLLEQTIENKKKLEKALSEIKLLRGFLPICVKCKRIRDDHGYWNQIEDYISSHSEAEFTHSICPECAKKLYGKDYVE